MAQICGEKVLTVDQKNRKRRIDSCYESDSRYRIACDDIRGQTSSIREGDLEIAYHLCLAEYAHKYECL